MSKLSVSKRAQADIRRIWRIVAQDRPASADALIDSFYSRFRLAAMNPEIGEDRSDIRKGLRILSVGKYVIGFRRGAKGISIVRVVHGARDWASLF
jgi:toxin ParE1/3/4